MGMCFGSPYRRSLLAEACLRLGQLDEAGIALAEARAEAEATGEHLRTAELHRLEGELHLARGDGDAMRRAEEEFRRALDTARGQRLRSGRAAEARGLLSSVYGWFTEGAELPDWVEARELLVELRAAEARSS